MRVFRIEFGFSIVVFLFGSIIRITKYQCCSYVTSGPIRDKNRKTKHETVFRHRLCSSRGAFKDHLFERLLWNLKPAHGNLHTTVPLCQRLK